MRNTKWLASVQSLAEAVALATCLPDILDMKNPSQGALGALPHQAVSDIVDWVDGRCLTSATVGDLPMQAALIAEAIKQMSQTRVDYVKVGLFNQPGAYDCLMQLKNTLLTLPTPVIAVLFADDLLDVPLADLQQMGFAGVMLDTAHKNGLGLRHHHSPAELQQFVDESRSLGLLCGLAGALKIEDIPPLAAFDADYLGFRSALCLQQARTTQLNLAQAQQVKQVLQAAVTTNALAV